jgi:hypothetical protein
MTEAQREKRRLLECRWKASPKAIYCSSRELLNWGCHLGFASHHFPIVVRTDEKKEYGRALRSLNPYGSWLEEGLVEHRMTSSKAARTLSNDLFSVNYLDRQLRKDLAEHVRETVRFSRRLEFSLERAVVHLVHHNYFKVFRSRSRDQQLTHADRAGLDRREVARWKESFFRDRALGWRHNLEGWASRVWRRATGVPVHPVTPLAAHLLTA